MLRTYCLFFGLVLTTNALEAGFFEEVAKGVAVNVLSEVIKKAINSSSDTPQTINGDNDDSRRIRGLISALLDSETALSERIGLYATKTDYFNAGVVDHAFIIKDRQRFEKRWPKRSYTIASIDEIAVDPSRKFAAARYTTFYHVSNDSDQRSGTSRVSILIGSFDAQPRIYAIKEWVSRN